MRRCLFFACLLLTLLICRAETLTLPPSVTDIEEEAFYGVAALTDVAFPDGVKRIGARAFADTSIETVSLPDSVAFIADDAFLGAPLKRVVAEEGSYARQWAIEHGYTWQSLCKELIINKNGQKITITLGLGEQVRIAVANPTSVVSAKPAVASVDGDYRVTALKEGTAKITVRAAGIKATVTVKVVDREKPTGIRLNASKLTLRIGDIYTLTATVSPDTARTSVIWTTSRASVATVKNGIVTAKVKGSATITATTSNGKKATLKLKVATGTPTLSITPAKPVVGVGESLSLSALLSGSAPNASEWLTEDENIVAIDGEGRAVGVSVGVTRVGVVANGYRAAVEVAVVPAAYSVEAPSALTLGVGERTSFSCRVLDADGGAYQGAVNISSLDAGTVSVDGTTMIAHEEGSTEILIRAGNVTRRVEIEVLPYYRVHTVQACAHRGGMGYWPENTLEAFRNTESTGAEMVEFDVWTAKDGVQVINHNATIAANGKKYTIASYTTAQLKALKPSLCTLEEALDVFRDTNITIQLELKNGANVKRCVDTIEAYGLLNRTYFISFNRTLIENVRKYSAKAKLGFIFDASTGIPSNIVSTAQRLNVEYLLPRYNLINEATIVKWHEAGLKVGVWPLATTEEIQEWIRLGVDGITCNWPDRVVQARETLD